MLMSQLWRRTTDDGRTTECEDRAILKQNSQFPDVKDQEACFDLPAPVDADEDEMLRRPIGAQVPIPAQVNEDGEEKLRRVIEPLYNL